MSNTAHQTRDIEKAPVLVTGASGYIGGRLVPRLLDAGYRVRCLVREPRKLTDRHWSTREGVQIVGGDAGDPASLRRAMKGCGAAYYLIHSMMAAGSEYRERDRELAHNFARAAATCGLGRIIYLGGLGETGEGLSEHLGSRREVEQALASGPVPVTVLRAAMIIGSGSASFEILRYLVERLPAMITPRWVTTECQPIAVRNALGYLVDCLQRPESTGRTLDIGGPDVLTYRELMRIMARNLGLKRPFIVPVPVLTPRLSSLWIHIVTPVSARFARPLAEGLRNRVVCRNDEAARLMPQPLIGVDEAIAAAMGQCRQGELESTWVDAGPMPGDPDWAGGTTFVDRRGTAVAASPQQVFTALSGIGGTRGWFAANALWRIRGALDRLIGGPGLARGRRDPDRLHYGDAVDFWRVSEVDADRRVELRAEMRLPGTAVLEFLIEPGPHMPASGVDNAPEQSPRAILTQIARFKPRGVLGLLYWYAVMPFHGFVFRGMIAGIRESAERSARSADGSMDLVADDSPTRI